MKIYEDKALKWLDKKWPKEKRTCEICSESEWTLADDLITPIIFNKNSTVMGGNSCPQFLVICNNCGNTKYFNAIIMGIIEGTRI